MICTVVSTWPRKAGLADHPQVTVQVYDGQDHAFARIGGAHYDRAAADLANGRSLAHLNAALAP